MASPDFKDYVDLTINDVQPADIYSAAVTYAQTSLPEFSPRQGTVEDAILQAMSYVSGVMTGAINRLPNGLMEGVLRLIGLTRSEATFATGNVIFTAIDTAGATIPAGTQVSYLETVDGVSTQHIFATTESATIAEGSDTSSAIPVVAQSAGQKPYIASGTSLIILVASNRLLSCATSGALTQGVTGESDEDFFNRGATYLASLSEALVTPTQITNYTTATYTDVHRAKTYNNTLIDHSDGVTIFESSGSLGASITADPNSDFSAIPTAGDRFIIHDATDAKFNGEFEVTSVGTSPDRVIYFSNSVGASTSEVYSGGYHLDILEGLATSRTAIGGETVTVVAGEEGAALTAADKATIQSDIEERLIAGLNYYVMNAMLVNIEVSITISVLPGFDELTVRTAVDTAITEYLSPDAWDWSTRVRVNSILSRASQVNGVDYVSGATIALDAGESKASIDGTTGDCIFTYDGSLPVASVSVGSI